MIENKHDHLLNKYSLKKIHVMIRTTNIYSVIKMLQNRKEYNESVLIPKDTFD